MMSVPALDLLFLSLILSLTALTVSGECAQQEPVFFEENYAAVDFARLDSTKQLSLCRVIQSFDSCTIQWFKDGERLMPSSNLMFVDNSQYIFIDKVVPSDAGNYSCSVTSHGGKISRSLMLKTYEDSIHPPFNNQWPTCKLDNTAPGGNLSATCLFDVGVNPDEVTCNWMKRNESATPGSEHEWLPMFIAEHIWGIQFNDSWCEEDPSYITCGSRRYPEGTTQIYSCLNLYSVTEEYYGKYILYVNNGQGVSLTFELSELIVEVPPPTYNISTILIVVFSIGVAFLLAVILWQLVKTDVKLFAKDNLRFEEVENDNKLYDAYISYNWNETDTQFALSLKRHLEWQGYKIFVPEVEITPGGCTVVEISEALEKSRRFVMILSDKYINGSLAAYEVTSFIDQVSRYKKHIISVVLGGAKVNTENCRTILKHVLKVSKVVKWKHIIPEEPSVNDDDLAVTRQNSTATVVPADLHVQAMEKSFKSKVFKELLLGMPPKPKRKRIDSDHDDFSMNNHTGNGFSNKV